MKLIDLSVYTANSIIKTENIIFLLKQSLESKEIDLSTDNFTLSVNHIAKFYEGIVENLILYISCINLFKNAKNIPIKNVLDKFINNTFNSGPQYLGDVLDGFTCYEVMEMAGVIPFNIRYDSISTVSKATEILNFYGQDTIPHILEGIAKKYASKLSTSNDRQTAYRQIVNELSQDCFDPGMVQNFVKQENTLTTDEVNFIVWYNESSLYNWVTCTISSPALSSFLDNNISNPKKLENLYTKLRELLELSASNIQTLSNFRIKKLDDNEPSYYLECVLFFNELHPHDLWCMRLKDFEYHSELIQYLNDILSNK